MRLGKDDILKAPGPVTEIVQVPEWGGEVAVRGMTGAERDAYEFSVLGKQGDGALVPDRKNLRARLVAWTVIDEDTGERLFTDEDVEELGRKSAAPVVRIAEVAARLSGLTAEDAEELAENFGGPTKAATEPGVGSASISPKGSAGSPSKGSSPRSAASS